MKEYIYHATIRSAYDGDSVRADIDLGFGIIKKDEKLRLWGINAPEIRGGTLESKARAKEAKDFVIDRTLGEKVLIKTYKDKKGKYGRYLAEILYKVDDKYININREMVLKGYAVEFMKGEQDFYKIKA